MSAHSDAELAALLRGGESHLVERKRSAGDRSGIRRNICAFANDIAGAGRPGAIFVGVEDDGTCANIQVDDSLMRNLAQMGSDGNILPLPDMTVERKIFEGRGWRSFRLRPNGGRRFAAGEGSGSRPARRRSWRVRSRSGA